MVSFKKTIILLIISLLSFSQWATAKESKAQEIKKLKYKMLASSIHDPEVYYEGEYSVEILEQKSVGNAKVIQLHTSDSFTIKDRFPQIHILSDRVEIKDVNYLGPLSQEVKGHNILFFNRPLAENTKSDDGRWITKVVKKERVSFLDQQVDAWKIYVIGTLNRQYTAVGNYWINKKYGIVKADFTIPDWHIKLNVHSVL